MNKNILLFISRILCYESNCFFVAELEKELIKLGYFVEVCELDTKEKDLEEKLEQYIGKTFRAIIDFNSALQRLEMDNGERYLDQINAPFYNYIVDHPLYHHPVIKLNLKQSNIICIDREHVNYINKYYQNIEKVIFMPLGAMQALNIIPYRERNIDVLFLGTYTSSKKILEQIEEDDRRDEIILLIDELKNNTNQTQEEALLKVLKHEGEVLNNSEFADRLNACHLADIYLRAYYREILLQILLDHNMDISVFGYGWEEFACRKKEHLMIKDYVSFPVSLEIIADSKVVLNIMPWFKDGVHDRVLSAMVNKAVCVTDSSTYVNENFTDGENLILYSLDQMEVLPSKIKEILINTKRAEEIIECGYQTVIEKHMWKNRIQENIELIDEWREG